MTLDDLRAAITAATKDTSENVRKLAFAGVAIVWLFSGASANAKELRFPLALLWVVTLLVSALIADLLQLVYRSISSQVFFRVQEGGGADEETDDIRYPGWFHYPSYFFFGLKILLTMLAYIILGVYLWHRIAVL